MSRPNIHKAPPPVLYIVKVDGAKNNRGSYRIFWSIKHASNYAEKYAKAGSGATILEYVAGAELAQFKPIIKEEIVV